MSRAPCAGSGTEGDPKLALDFVESRQAVTGVVVADLVHEACPPVQSHEVGAQ
jgi:hypothetical protein